MGTGASVPRSPEDSDPQFWTADVLVQKLYAMGPEVSAAGPRRDLCFVRNHCFFGPPVPRGTARLRLTTIMSVYIVQAFLYYVNDC
jgi:hypothetical protein